MFIVHTIRIIIYISFTKSQIIGFPESNVEISSSNSSTVVYMSAFVIRNICLCEISTKVIKEILTTHIKVIFQVRTLNKI